MGSLVTTPLLQNTMETEQAVMEYPHSWTNCICQIIISHKCCVFLAVLYVLCLFAYIHKDLAWLHFTPGASETNGNEWTAHIMWTVYDVFWHVSETFHLQDESSIESDEFDMSDSTRMSAVNSDLSSNLEERMQSPQNLQGQQDGKALVSYRKCGIALSFSHSLPSFSTCCVLFFIVCFIR